LVEKKPEPLPYPQSRIKHRTYGKKVDLLVKKAIEEKDPEKRQAFAQTIGNFMKLVYQTWTKENTNDEIIKNDLRILSDDKLQLGLEDNISELTKGNKFREVSNPVRDNRKFSGNRPNNKFRNNKFNNGNKNRNK
jgi:hypothetical protein